MHKRWPKFAILGFVLVVSAFGIHLARTRPGLFSNQSLLGGVIFLQVLLACIWKFRQSFFTFLMVAFTGAGLDLPLAGAWTSLRWIVLAVGALVGFMVFMHDRRRQFGVVHLLAFCCVLGAFVSAGVSVLPRAAFLKAVSLFLLFLYASSGGRLAILGRESGFLRGLVWACEVTVYLTFPAYVVFHTKPWGNTNSLGLVMGVVVAPVLLWAVLTTKRRVLRWRYSFGLVLAIFLLFFGLSRAGILADFVAMAVLLILARKRRLLISSSIAVLALVAVLALWDPVTVQNYGSESAKTLLYKGHQQEGLLGSRRSPWQETMDVISQHPWFGSGFGTSPVGAADDMGNFSSTASSNREHGSSFLTILEWVGLVGILPFVALLFMLVWTIGRMLVWVYRANAPSHPAVPIVLVLVAALIHAGFEDWLFAVGFYLTILFWTFAFMLVDFVEVLDPSPMKPMGSWRLYPAGGRLSVAQRAVNPMSTDL